MKTTLFTILAFLQFYGLTPPAATNTVSVGLTTTASPKGSIRLAVFANSEALMEEKPVSGEVIDIPQATLPLRITLKELPQGAFAIAAFHDLNNDGKLNRNIFGVPSEPYAFSGQPASKWRAPLWEEVAIKEAKQLQLDLRFWKEQ